MNEHPTYSYCSLHVLNGTIIICSQTNQTANNVDLATELHKQSNMHLPQSKIFMQTVTGQMCIRTLLGLLQSKYDHGKHSETIHWQFKQLVLQICSFNKYKIFDRSRT